MSLYSLIGAIFHCGINLMTLLHFSSKRYPRAIALIDDDETVTYEQLFQQATQLAFSLKKSICLHSHQKVAFLCKNHLSLIKAIFAVSRLGADLYLLNTEMSCLQFNHLVARNNFDLLIYDESLSDLVDASTYSQAKILSYHDSLPAINNFLCLDFGVVSLPRTYTGKLILQTSGTTGACKSAIHKPSLFNYLSPFIGFIERLNISSYNTAYIATPIDHGYGIAVLLLFIPLGKKIIVTSGFNASTACHLIDKHGIEVITVVPLMLQKMLQANKSSLKSLACIASGSSKLSAKLVLETFQELGYVLYNLYGTSESGLNLIATPHDLIYSSDTVGKKINGVNLSILDKDMKEVGCGKIGQLCIRPAFSKRKTTCSWIQTGDLGYQDQHGYYFLCGRIDDMIVSGGENVYPIQVEKILITHPLVKDTSIIGISDADFGERLKAFVVLREDATITESDLLNWLRPQVSRFQLPKEIQFTKSLPYTASGKPNKKQLR
jgi:acyl-CoA synthetase (AMP-forming)/AMP-acid ligase II